jgi:pimeloyl-ACP methyl ester carboxylesterase
MEIRPFATPPSAPPIPEPTPHAAADELLAMACRVNAIAGMTFISKWSVVLATFSGCALLLPPVNPVVTVDDDFSGRAKCLVVFLPGIGDIATDFEDKGFVESLRDRGLSVDVISAQVTLAYYTQGTVVLRLGEDVFAPAKIKHYRQTWLIGLSMGGLGTLLYSHDHPREITGVLALAPYLGVHPLAAKIRDEGGLSKWKAPEKVLVTDEDTSVQELWRWLQALTSGRERGPRLYLGWGTEDVALGLSNEVLAAALPVRRRFPVSGGHAWVAWKQSLDLFLDDSDFRKGCGR